MTKASETQAHPGWLLRLHPPIFGEDVFLRLALICVFWCLCCGCRSRWWQSCQKHKFPPFDFDWIEQMWGAIWKKMNNNVEDNQHNESWSKQLLFQAIVLKKNEDETGLKSFKSTRLPLLSEEIKLLIIADIFTYFWNLMALVILILLEFLLCSDCTTEMIHCRRRLWHQYFKFLSLCDEKSARKASVLNLCQVWTSEHLTLASQSETWRQRNVNTASSSRSAFSLPSNQLSASSLQAWK